ncbi:MAG TPA: valine--tRNA ligase [Actinomycetota bacterium]|nr:valine--tRNA ligase [Actinomycetota bacterium]
MADETVSRLREDMPPAYEASQTERRWYEEWERRGYFGAKPNSGREPFCIVLPPPNITGALHIGHAFQQLLQDIVIRRKRMQGFEALWLPGTDHAGIATQVVVERELAKEGIDRRELGREAFVERVWQWKEQYGGRIVEQMKALGNSCDWSRLRFTMDEGLAHAVRVAFVTLYDDGLIYRGERLVNWCPRDTTALSDSEVEHEDVDGELITFRYDLSDGSGHIDVATTRVETMLGDTGVAVHPDDPRYADLVGKTVRHPFTGQDLPIVADQAVDPAFGTGAVKVTPAHDPTDFEIGQRHGMPLVNILTAEARISDQAPKEFRGLDRYEARLRVLERLRELGAVVKEERPYVHSVGHCYRCHAEIEPWLSGKQWFVAMDRLKVPAKDAALDGRIRFWPERWVNAYTQWLDGLRDWNISRQLWWGHRIPVWYCVNGHETAAVEDPAACATCGSAEIEQDPDVLDTWFSSQLWPFSTLGWPESTEDLAFFYPTSTLVTGYEILYLWVARMIMSGLYLAGDVPFRHAVIHGLVRDPQGRKMSKSLGNVIDPLDAIERFGADALRFGLTRQATDAQNIPFGEEHIDGGRRFANKLWNAARLALSGHEGRLELPAADALTLPERWLLSRHQACFEAVDTALETYQFAEAGQALYRFLWSEYCDWGLEVEKLALREGSPDERSRASAVLTWVLERSLRLLHPIMPFVTEEVWQRFDIGESIMVASWPEPHPGHRDPEAEDEFAFAEELVGAIRRFRKSHGLRDSLALTATVAGSDWQRAVAEGLRPEIERLANASLEIRADPGDPAGSARLAADGAQVLIPLAGVLDPEAERARLAKRIAEVQASAARSESKLGSEGFVAKAPPEVVEQERQRLVQARDEAAALAAQLDELG